MSRGKEKHHSHEAAVNARKEAGHKPGPEAPVASVTEAMPSAASPDAGSAAPQAEGTGGQETASASAVKPEVTLEQLQDQWLRLRADFDNFRKRTLREKKELYACATSELMLELLPVLDHLQLGIQATIDHQADKAIQEGLQLIFDQLMGVLMKFGLSPFDVEKQPFDPTRFEAVSHLSSEKEPEGMVLAQIRRGYLLRGKLLRPAQVVVSSGPRKDTSKTTEESPSPGSPVASAEESGSGE